MPTETSFLSPERIVSYLNIPRGGVVADFGAGFGFYAVPLARSVGPEGKVYAFDVQAEAISEIRSRARLLHFLQLDAVRVDLERDHGSRLRDAVADLVLVASILHQAENKNAVLLEAARILKPGRTMVIIEWDNSSVPAGPAQNFRIPKSKAKEMAEAAGFILDREFEAGSHHYGLLFKKR
jgi:ubiquinone/menaquinone biosynthesis C-methylase UbiE